MCIDPTALLKIGSVRSSHLPLKMQVGYVCSSLSTLMHVGSIATPTVKSTSFPYVDLSKISKKDEVDIDFEDFFSYRMDQLGISA